MLYTSNKIDRDETCNALIWLHMIVIIESNYFKLSGISLN